LFPLGKHEWSFCQQPDCTSPERVEHVQDRLAARLWLQQFKDDPLEMRVLRDFVEDQFSLPLSRMSDESVVQQIAELLISDRLHLHEKKPEAQPAGGRPKEEESVAFPLSERRPGSSSSSPPPQVIEPPTFSSKLDPAAQAATLVAAAAAGKPFCPE
jgi:hypothetical protein